LKQGTQLLNYKPLTAKGVIFTGAASQQVHILGSQKLADPLAVAQGACRAIS
jgi:hypothetical protein